MLRTTCIRIHLGINRTGAHVWESGQRNCCCLRQADFPVEGIGKGCNAARWTRRWGPHRAHSVDLRERSLRALTSGMPMAEVAHVFDVGRQPVSLAPSAGRQSRIDSGARGRAARRSRLAHAGGCCTRCHLGRALCAMGDQSG